jgi:hypothetical protein
MKKAATPKKLAPSVAWDALWGGYIRALRANKLDQAERFKKMIDGFDRNFLGLEAKLVRCPSCDALLPVGAPRSQHKPGCTAARKR